MGEKGERRCNGSGKIGLWLYRKGYVEKKRYCIREIQQILSQRIFLSIICYLSFTYLLMFNAE